VRGWKKCVVRPRKSLVGHPAFSNGLSNHIYYLPKCKIGSAGRFVGILRYGSGPPALNFSTVSTNVVSPNRFAIDHGAPPFFLSRPKFPLSREPRLPLATPLTSMGSALFPVAMHCKLARPKAFDIELQLLLSLP